MDELEDCKKENKLLREQLDLCIDMGRLITKKLDKIKWKPIRTAPKDGKPFFRYSTPNPVPRRLPNFMQSFKKLCWPETALGSR
jgi:hypothetical protein